MDKKEIKYKYKTQTDVRVNFIDNLQKLNNNSTRNNSYTVLKTIIKLNPSQQFLRIYLSSLMSLYSQTTHIQGKEYIILLYGYLANIYRNNLIDPIDARPSINKTLKRICDHIKNYCLAENSYTIHKACSYSLLELYDLCMDKNNYNNVYNIFIEPFTDSIFNNVNKYIKDGACVYLNDFIFKNLNGNGNLDKKNLNTNMNIIFNLVEENKYIENMCKINCYDNQFLFESIYNIIKYSPFEIYDNYITDVINRVMIVLGDAKNTYHYLSVVSCLNIMGLIGWKIKDKNIKVSDIDNIIENIKNYFSDKSNEVRNAAKEAIKSWDEILKNDFLDIGNKKMQFEKEEKKNLLNNMRNKLKQGDVQHIAENEAEIISKMKKEIYNKGIGDILRVTKFLKEHSKPRDVEVFKSKGTNSSNNKFNMCRSNDVRKYDFKQQMPFEGNYNINEAYSYGNNNYSANMDSRNNMNNMNNMNDRNNINQDIYFLPTQKNNDDENNSKYNINNDLNDLNKQNKINNNQIEVIKEEKDEESSCININNPDINQVNQIKSINNIFKYINFSEIKNSFNSLQKTLSKSEKIITLKIYKTESTLEKINSTLQKNKKDICLYHNNILNDTVVDDDSATIIMSQSNNNLISSINNYNNPHMNLMDYYNISLNYLNKNDIENAFLNILENGDDIYLIRLLLLKVRNLENFARNCDVNVFKQILFRMNQICKSHFMEKMIIDMIVNIHQNLNKGKGKDGGSERFGVKRIIDKSFANELLETLDIFSRYKNESITKQASFLYNLIISDFQ